MKCNGCSVFPGTLISERMIRADNVSTAKVLLWEVDFHPETQTIGPGETISATERPLKATTLILSMRRKRGKTR